MFRAVIAAVEKIVLIFAHCLEPTAIFRRDTDVTGRAGAASAAKGASISSSPAFLIISIRFMPGVTAISCTSPSRKVIVTPLILPTTSCDSRTPRPFQRQHLFAMC